MGARRSGWRGDWLVGFGGATHVGVGDLLGGGPKVGLRVLGQPWALGRNPVWIVGEGARDGRDGRNGRDGRDGWDGRGRVGRLGRGLAGALRAQGRAVILTAVQSLRLLVRRGAYGVLCYGVGNRGCREWLAVRPGCLPVSRTGWGRVWREGMVERAADLFGVGDRNVPSPLACSEGARREGCCGRKPVGIVGAGMERG